MTELRDIEESIRYSCRKNANYGEDLIRRINKAFAIQNQVESMIDYLQAEIKRTDVESYRSLCKSELVMYEGILKHSERQIPNEVKHE